MFRSSCYAAVHPKSRNNVCAFRPPLFENTAFSRASRIYKFNLLSKFVFVPGCKTTPLSEGPPHAASDDSFRRTPASVQPVPEDVHIQGESLFLFADKEFSLGLSAEGECLVLRTASVPRYKLSIFSSISTDT